MNKFTIGRVTLSNLRHTQINDFTKSDLKSQTDEQKQNQGWHRRLESCQERDQ